MVHKNVLNIFCPESLYKPSSDRLLFFLEISTTSSHQKPARTVKPLLDLLKHIEPSKAPSLLRPTHTTTAHHVLPHVSHGPVNGTTYAWLPFIFWRWLRWWWWWWIQAGQCLQVRALQLHQARYHQRWLLRYLLTGPLQAPPSALLMRALPLPATRRQTRLHIVF